MYGMAEWTYDTLSYLTVTVVDSIWNRRLAVGYNMISSVEIILMEKNRMAA